ncbi:MAG: Asp-tRNA(Asn)/Glu-tRNA(Gln) amidotransferase subunit GatC [Pseudomonadota bacterium]
MSVDRETVERIAHLARLAIPDQKIGPLQNELNTILAWVEQLNAVDTHSVEPMASALSMSLKMREDAVTDGGYPERVTGNAPEAEDQFFTVPKVVE